MGKTYDAITPELRAFIDRQRIFFVATAPLDGAGHVNVSPKGLDTFRVLDERRIAYLDLTGSGNETSAHLEENGRITVMFCAFEGPPRILRLYGRGRTVLPGASEWEALAAGFPALPGIRQIVMVGIERVATSCGFGVPLYGFTGNRSQMAEWAERKGPDGLRDYRRQKNAVSIDGLPTPIAKAFAAAE
jgi:hypothetical protein